MANIRVLGEQIIPSASRLMNSLRNLGYDFSQAVADLVDNSIEAGASVIAIDVEFDGDHSRVRISDNGVGMSLDQLKEAMRFGTERLYDTEEGLGKFGLGLKTASLSQCKKLSVASRSNPQKKEVNAYCWDMMHIEQTNRWELVVPDDKDMERILDSHLTENTGTVILWQFLDRMLGFKHPYGEFARKNLLKMCRELEQHLTMVFHRYMAGEVPNNKLTIILNGNQLVPWDPFARNETKTIVKDCVQIRLEYEGITGNVALQPYVLPNQSGFSSIDAFNRASGPLKWNQQQGFYIYRANRLIQSGGWSHLRTIDEHTKLARIGLSFSPHLDDAFKINVAKMKVQLPESIQDQISEAIKPVIKKAMEIYRKSNQKTSTPTIPPTSVSLPPSPSSNTYPSRLTNNYPPNPFSKSWTLDELQAALEKSSEPDEKPILTKIFTRFRKSLTNKG